MKQQDICTHVTHAVRHHSEIHDHKPSHFVPPLWTPREQLIVTGFTASSRCRRIFLPSAVFAAHSTHVWNASANAGSSATFGSHGTLETAAATTQPHGTDGAETEILEFGVEAPKRWQRTKRWERSTSPVLLAGWLASPSTCDRKSERLLCFCRGIEARPAMRQRSTASLDGPSCASPRTASAAVAAPSRVRSRIGGPHHNDV